MGHDVERILHLAEKKQVWYSGRAPQFLQAAPHEPTNIGWQLNPPPPVVFVAILMAILNPLRHLDKFKIYYL